MARRRRLEIPTPLTQGRDRCRAWLRTRKLGARIPDRLWELAAKLAGAHGISRTASILGLDYYALKKRVESTDSDIGSSDPAFVELSMASLDSPPECVIEFEDVAGVSMRVHLIGYDAPDLAALSRSLWNGE